MKVPEQVIEVLKALESCWAERRCMLCSDCVAFAILFIEDLDPLPEGKARFMTFGVRQAFMKFIESTIAKPRNQCPYCKISAEQANEFALFLLKLNKEQRRLIRTEYLKCHAEFKEPELSRDDVIVLGE